MLFQKSTIQARKADETIDKTHPPITDRRAVPHLLCAYDILNYSSYSIRLEKLKTAYRTLFPIFVRIAFLLNSYLKFGIAECKVSFDGVWNKLTKMEEKIIALSALHWIGRDFKEKFGDADTPHTKKILCKVK